MASSGVVADYIQLNTPLITPFPTVLGKNTKKQKETDPL